jgi:diadenosine tetraphosphatase ApaH/serine/threonine PP2A family protein phosphatase
MRVAVLSDIHANLAALEAVLESVADRADEVWCLGDVVGYGARPNECAQAIRDRCTIVLAGNHDLAACGRIPSEAFSSDAGRAIRWTREVLRSPVEQWLASLGSSYLRGPVGLYHASPRDPVWDYVVDPDGARDALTVAPCELVLVGHTHTQLAARLFAGRLAGGPATVGTELELGQGRRALLNPGSVGQPRDADPRAAWLWLWLADDGHPLRAVFERTRYDIARTQGEILEAGLPEHLADRLSFGM